MQSQSSFKCSVYIQFLKLITHTVLYVKIVVVNSMCYNAIAISVSPPEHLQTVHQIKEAS